MCTGSIKAARTGHSQNEWGPFLKEFIWALQEVLPLSWKGDKIGSVTMKKQWFGAWAVKFDFLGSNTIYLTLGT